MNPRRRSIAKSNQGKFLLSSDTLEGYGLDFIFSLAKRVGFDWLDLSMWKNFDAWNADYVQWLVKEYELPVKIIQVSGKVNRLELNKAVDLATKLGVDTIVINPPRYLDVKTFKFIKDNLPAYKKVASNIKFAIVNWDMESSLTLLPILPGYSFVNIADIVKKYKAYLALELVHLKEEVLEMSLLKKLGNFLPYVVVTYLSDRDRSWKKYLPLGEGSLKLPTILKKFKQFEYDWYFSLRLKLGKKILADSEKVEIILKKCRNYFKEYYEDLKLG